MQRSAVDGVGEDLRTLLARFEEQEPAVVVADDDRAVGAGVESEEVPRGVGEDLDGSGGRVDGEQTSVCQARRDAAVGQDGDVFGCGSGKVDTSQSGHGTFISVFAAQRPPICTLFHTALLHSALVHC
ncbi:hypothetical protein nbrc107696_27780 [Gordonia spumicola]|uniref:Uncharacterized protein n=1 Tax=Gordonia spumicola TaxID=589161 RepID=A0A7I9VAQ8_9ACTN|nr:hypothetical protein nbrc107696_27780 [Gordonia spumicola]